jgi:DNA-binding MarR family transcriptional regulator
MTEKLENFDLSHFLPYRLAVAAGRVSRALARRYESRFGLSIPEWRVLAHLVQEGEVSIRNIHSRIDMDKSKASRAASRLEQAGLITKVENPADRRLVSLSLTDRGRETMRDLIPMALAFEAEVLALIGRDHAAFDAGLEEIIGRLK